MSTDAIIVGLGNPGKEYEKTRHNVGFMAVSRFAAAHGLRFSSKRFQAELATGEVDGKVIALAKPQTFMNNSGTTVVQLKQWYKLPPARILIVYDELDLPFGTLRLRPGGSANGHNGIKHIMAQLGTQDVPRLRIGVGRPPGSGEAISYVLKSFPPAERDLLESEILPAAADAIEAWLNTTDIEAAMQIVNAAKKD